MLRFIFLVLEMEFNLKNSLNKRLENMSYFHDLYEKKSDKNIYLIEDNLEYTDFDFELINTDYNIKLYFIKSIISNFYIDTYENISYINSIIFQDCKFNKGLLINNNSQFTFNFWDYIWIFKELIISYEKTDNNWWLLNFTNFRIIKFLINNNYSISTSFKKIRIYNNIELKYFLVENINIWELILENINNNFESFEIRNCKVGKLVIKNSNLWNAVFNWVEIWELEIQNVTLNDCIFNWVDFYNNYKLSNNNWNISTRTLKDNYRQLKHVMDKNWNHTEANNFYALEMEEYMKFYNNINKLSYKEVFKNIFDIKKSSNYWEKLILNFNYLINNFWTNIILNMYTIFIYLSICYGTSFVYSYIIVIINWELTTKTDDKIIITLLSITCFTCLLIMKKIIANYPLITTLFFILLVTFFWYFFNFTNIDSINFKWLETLVYLLNPFSWLATNTISHLHLLEKFWLIIHKIIYWILIYQLIIALKRTTRR